MGRALIEAMARALTREGHVLRAHPRLLFQQLYGRLQWDEGPAAEVVAREREGRGAPGAAPWAHVKTRVGGSEAFVGALVGHTAYVDDCAIAPDGSWIVSVGADQTVRLWDPVTRRELASLPWHPSDEEERDQICAVSPVGSWFLTAAPGSVTVWDTATRTQRGSFSGGEAPMCAMSPDGSWFVTCVDNHHPAIWDVEPLSRRALLDGHRERVMACAVSPDGRLIASADAGGELWLWDVATASVRARMEGRTGGHAGPCAFGPNGTWIVSQHYVYTQDEESGSVLKIWDVATASETATLAGHTSTVLTIAVSPDGRWIASGSHDETLKVWDAASGNELATLVGHTDSVNACEVSPDAAFLVSASWDGTVKIWDALSALAGERQAARANLIGHQRVVQACPVSPDGGSIVSASADGTLRLWDVSAQTAGAAPRPHARPAAALEGAGTGGVSVHASAASPDGALFVSAGEDTVKLWNATDGSERGTLRGHTDRIWSCVVSPDGTWVASASSDQTLRIFHLPGGRERAVLRGHTAPVVACAPGPDGSWLVSAGWDNTVRIWDARDGAELAILAGHEGWVESCAVGPDGSWIVSGSWDGTVRSWDTGGRGRTIFSADRSAEIQAVSPDGSWIAVVAGDALTVLDPRTGDERARLHGHEYVVEACAASPDGRWMVSASVDETLKIWDLVGGAEPVTLRGHTGPVRECTVSPDGRWIASTSDDEVSRVWSIATGGEVATIPLPWAPFCVCWHPHRPTLFLAGEHGMVALVDLVGIEFGPPVTLPIDVRRGPPAIPRRRGGKRRPARRAGGDGDGRPANRD